MNTSSDTTRRTLPPGMAASAVLGLLAATLTAGCGELSPAEELSLQAATSAIGECPTGNCGDPNNNGKGLFIVEGSSYCSPNGTMGSNSFCPEFFTNLPNGGVQVTGQTTDESGQFYDPPQYFTFPLQGVWKGVPVMVSRILQDNQELVVTVIPPNNAVRVLTGSDLTNLVLNLTGQGTLYSMRFSPAAPENGIGLYHVEYSIGTVGTWQPYCQDGTGTAAFLPERTVNTVSGAVRNSAGRLTMSCRTGAIATCMVWGYKPWESAPADQAQADYLYGSCLQAKRAAYFVKYGDFNSYTVAGTPIALQDKAGIMNVSMSPGVEAVWSPEGAVCFTPAHRRIPGPGAPSLPALPASNSIPLCTEQFHQAALDGVLAGLLQDDAPLATGRMHD